MRKNKPNLKNPRGEAERVLHDFGLKISKRRDELNMSQNEVSNELGISRSTYANWELHNSLPASLESLVELVDVFECDYNYLFSYEENHDNSDAWVYSKDFQISMRDFHNGLKHPELIYNYLFQNDYFRKFLTELDNLFDVDMNPHHNPAQLKKDCSVRALQLLSAMLLEMENANFKNAK